MSDENTSDNDGGEDVYEKYDVTPDEHAAGLLGGMGTTGSAFLFSGAAKEVAKQALGADNQEDVDAARGRMAQIQQGNARHAMNAVRAIKGKDPLPREVLDDPNDE